MSKELDKRIKKLNQLRATTVQKNHKHELLSKEEEVIDRGQITEPDVASDDPTNGLKKFLESSSEGAMFKMIFCGFECNVQIKSIVSNDWGGSRPGNLLISMKILGEPIGEVDIIEVNTGFELDEDTKFAGLE